MSTFPDAKLTGVIGLDASPFSKVLNTLPGMASRTSGKISSSFRGVAIAMAAVGAATAAVTIKAARMAAGFEKGMAEVETIFGGTADQLDVLKDKTLALGRAMGENTTVLTRALYQTISAGITDASDATLVLEKATIFAKAALVDTETAVDVLTTVLNSYNLSAEKAGHVSNVLFETIRLGKLRGEELASSLGRVTSIAASAGIQLEELTAILSAGTQRGLRFDVAVTGLRATILSILKPSAEATKLAKLMGVEWNAAALKAKGLRGIMADLEQKTRDTTWAKKQLTAATADFNRMVALDMAGEKGLSKAIKEAGKEMGVLKGIIDGTLDPVVQLVGSARALSLFLAASNAEAERGSITSNFDAMVDSAGAAQNAAEIMMETVDHKWAVMAANMEQAMIRFGTSVLPIIQSVLDKVNETFDEFDELNKAAKGAFGKKAVEEGGIAILEEFEKGPRKLGEIGTLETMAIVDRVVTERLERNVKRMLGGFMEPTGKMKKKTFLPSIFGEEYAELKEVLPPKAEMIHPGAPEDFFSMMPGKIRDEIEYMLRQRVGFDSRKGARRMEPPGQREPERRAEEFMEINRQLAPELKKDVLRQRELGMAAGEQRVVAAAATRAVWARAREKSALSGFRDPDEIPRAEEPLGIPTGIRRGGRRKGPRGMPFPKGGGEGDTNVTINITGVIDEKMVEKLIKDIERYAKRKGGKDFRVESGTEPAAPPTGVR